MADVHLFVIRVWQHLSQFRASVRSVDEEEPRLFQRPEDVGEFLRRAAGVPSAAADETPADPPG